MNSKTTFWLSTATAGWFLALRIVNHFNIDFVLVGVFGEMFTIPFLLAIPVCLWFSLRNFRKDGYKTGTAFWSVILTLAALLLIIM